MRRLLSSRLTRVIATLAVLLGGASAALAYFSAPGAGTALATVPTIIGPSGVGTQQTGANVTITWSAATLSSGPAVQGYKVTRSDASIVCGSPTPVTSLRCTDSNVGSGTYTYTVAALYNSWDSTAASGPITLLSAPTITSSPPATSANANAAPSIAFSGGGGSTYQCKLDAGSFTACSSPESLKTLNGNANLADGSHTFTVQAAQGSNTGPTAGFTWTVNTSAPSITAKPASPSANGAPLLSFTDAAYTSFQCKLDAGSFTACSSPESLKALNANTVLGDGSHTFTLEALDSSGTATQTVAYTWTINTTAPTITSKPASTSANPSPSFAFTDSVGAYTFKCQLDGAAFTACTNPKSPSGLANGSHTFVVQAVDSDGFAVPATVSYTWTVNATAPTLSSTPPSFTSSASAAFSFSQTAYTGFKCQLDGGGFTACTSPKSYTGLSDAAHSFQVQALDADGIATAVATYTWTVDTTAPTVTAVASQDSAGGTAGKLQNGDQLIITFSKPLMPASVPTSIAAGAANESTTGSGADVKLTIPGITQGALDTGSCAYLSSLACLGSATATFGGTVALVNTGTSATVTLTASGLAGTATAASSGKLTFTPATTIQDQLGGPATGTFTTASTFKLF